MRYSFQYSCCTCSWNKNDPAVPSACNIMTQKADAEKTSHYLFPPTLFRLANHETVAAVRADRRVTVFIVPHET